jgi:hypothetical protein
MMAGHKGEDVVCTTQTAAQEAQWQTGESRW